MNERTDDQTRKFFEGINTQAHQTQVLVDVSAILKPEVNRINPDQNKMTPERQTLPF